MAKAAPIRLLSAPVYPGLPTVIDAYHCHCMSRNLSKCTIALNRIVTAALALHCAGIDIDRIGAQDIRRFLILKAQQTSPATAARYYDTLRAFFRFAEDEGFINRSPMAQVVKPRFPKPVIEPLDKSEVVAMLDTCDKSFVGMRDRAALMILIDCGLRASELCDLDTSDIDWADQTLLVRHGKGDKSRVVPFGQSTAAAVRQYLARRAGVECERLMITSLGTPLTRYRLRDIMERRAKRAGIDRSRVGAHLMRHTFAVELLRNGCDTFSLQKMLGHSSLEMSRRYSQLADTDVLAKHRKASPGDSLNLRSAPGRKRLK